MTDVKSTKGLKKEEVEKGIHGTVVELPFVPIQDEEAESTAKDITVKLPNDTKKTITEIAQSANKELFLTRSIIVKNYVEKDLGLYAEAEEHEKGLEKCQIDIDQYYQPESATRQDQRKKAKYDEAMKEYDRVKKLCDEVIQKTEDAGYLQALHRREQSPHL
jgi:N-acetylmuramoyl-L-alanine amidase CwlA